MSSKTYEDKIKNIAKWVSIHNKYWHKYEGYLNDRKDHWNETFHSQTADDHQDWVDIIDNLYQEFPKIFDDNPRYKHIFEDTQEISRRIVHGEPVTKKHKRNHNFPVFRAWMTIKDIFNDISGKPTKQYPRPGDPKIKVSPGLQRQRAKNDKVAAKAAMFESLFDIERK